MTPAEAIALLRRGRCTAAKLGEAGCATCERTDEAMRALVAEGALRAKSDALAVAEDADTLGRARFSIAAIDEEAIAGWVVLR